MLRKPSIVSIGAGNVAVHLIKELYKKEYPVLMVYSRTIKAARELSEITGSGFTNRIEEIPSDADIYIITLSDNAILQTVNILRGTSAIVVHTAGSIDMSVFNGKISRHGVLYPLQTFTKSRKVDFSSIPLLIEGSDKSTVNILRRIASDLSESVTEVNSQDRKWIHISAVFACNFTNHMLACACDILSQRNLDAGLIRPLIYETFNKALEDDPGIAQTGPARRNNLQIVNEHISMLRPHPQFQKIYTFVSNAIMEYYQGGKNKEHCDE